MNIQITPNFQSKTSYVQNQNKFKNSAMTMPRYNNALTHDTVSFGNSISKGGATIADHLEAQVAASAERLLRIATTYLDIVESVAIKLKDKGFSFDRAYCELNPVKSPKSYASKVVRSGSFKVPDTIRTTLYCNNPYDLDNLFKNLLPEMEKRGYVIPEIEETVENLMKRGYIPTAKEAANPKMTKMVPDLDIRLDLPPEELAKVPARYRFCVGKPQKSGYEDIQMRFIRDFDKKSNPVQHELLVLFGPNYAHAKHCESSDVYNHLREMDELHFSMNMLNNKTVGSNAQKAERYMDLLKQMFRGKISQKLFLNAKNKDYAEIDDRIPITFSKEDEQLFEGYFNGLKLRVTNLYKDARKTATPTEKRQLTKDYKSDFDALEDIHGKLKATIDNYNEKPEV